jgi:acyl-CoA reductase-like NAD-dependent aldehyde dehydrogenase
LPRVTDRPPPASSGPLSGEEARVLGCLIEKSVTTPDSYPLSLNSLRFACNQSSNREPVVRYDDATVDAALDALRARQLVRRVKNAGERVIKHRHVADETLQLDLDALALLCVLLLRGPQTPGELKQRTERLHPFPTLAAVEEVLASLASRGFVARGSRLPGQNQARWVQLLSVTTGAKSAGSDAAGPEVVAPDVAAGPSDIAATVEIRNPATHAVVRTIACDTRHEIAAKLHRARTAQPAWAGRGLPARRSAVLELANLLGAEVEMLARTTTSETGRAIAQSRNEVRAAVERVRWYAANVDAAIASREPGDAGDAAHTFERVTYEPRGVVAHVSAWNYPYFVGLNAIVPALLTANAVLYKPSELATLTGLAIVDVAHRAGVPVDVLQCVVGAGPTGAALVESGVDLICFTGSHDTGSKVARAATERLVPVQLELGGKDALYVCDDVDVEWASGAAAEGAFYHGGQSCCAVERIYVHERIWEPFVAAFVASVHGVWTLGDPDDDTTTLGALARAEQPAFLQSQVDDAVAKGARVLLGGVRPLERTGNWYPPTVLVDVDHMMRVMRDETFGPVIGLMRVRDDDEALERMHDTRYGLTGAVFTEDRTRAERLLGALDTGSVYWNCADRTSARLEWAGRRGSGIGVSMGIDGMRAFVRPKAWHLRPPPPRAGEPA